MLATMPQVCKHCGTINRTPTLPGSGWIELILWLAWLVPGLIYSIWRRGGRTPSACSACGRRELVPLDSPVGRGLAGNAPLPPEPVSAPSRIIHRAGNVLFWLLVGLLMLGTLLAWWGSR